MRSHRTVRSGLGPRDPPGSPVERATTPRPRRRRRCRTVASWQGLLGRRRGACRKCLRWTVRLPWAGRWEDRRRSFRAESFESHVDQRLRLHRRAADTAAPPRSTTPLSAGLPVSRGHSRPGCLGVSGRPSRVRRTVPARPPRRSRRTARRHRVRPPSATGGPGGGRRCPLTRKDKPRMVDGLRANVRERWHYRTTGVPYGLRMPAGGGRATA
jgi:hypothetical protein